MNEGEYIYAVYICSIYMQLSWSNHINLEQPLQPWTALKRSQKVRLNFGEYRKSTEFSREYLIFVMMMQALLFQTHLATLRILFSICYMV